MDGLEAIVKKRGGIEALDAGSLAKKITVWYDKSSDSDTATRSR
jgi:hypothetical protein